MKSLATSKYWRLYTGLPKSVRDQARKQYRLWKDDPWHPSLQFKRLHTDLWSVRVSGDYRALGIRDGDEVHWFWIGTHAEYDHLIRR